ncbi:MAG TPA: tetratricopeptide repeat protein [Vicinamibacterales bacterium]
MSDASRCPACQSLLLADGTCPQCLLRIGLGAERDTPKTVGPYRIVEKLGEGGMGVVYLAEQDTPIRRRVALKLIKLGLDTRQVIARFESERQALALMQHPNVAAVYDAGATDDGRPYFVMEYVAGVPITDYCDQRRLAIPERLRLFAQACDAIQHAHQKGVIHRDVKPTNVLVTSVDEVATVKVIDFGVAKATTARLAEQTFFTEHGAIIGTPAYMSPEQADPFNPDIDTRTDVYSLGVLLYELATGALPFDTRALLKAGYDEIRRQIREADPPRPSTRVSTLGDQSIEAARNRRTDPKTLQSELRGDLDWVVMRALDKDPSRRYGSPSELGADLRRYLSHQPVEARPPHAVYRLRKMARRHRVAVIGAALVVLSITVGGALAAWQAIRATRAEREAQQQAATAQQVAAFLQSLFEGADPTIARGNAVTARQLIERGRERIDKELTAQPEVRARLQTLLGNIYRMLGLYREGTPLLRDALATRERLHPLPHRDVAESAFLLGRITNDSGDNAGGDRFYQRARQILEALPPDAGDPALLASVISEQALFAVLHTANYDRAEALYRESLSIRERVLGSSHQDVASSWTGLGNVFYQRGDFAKAEDAFRRALAIRRDRLGADSPEVALSLSHLASALGRVGRDREAEPMMLEAVRIQEKTFGPVHPQVAGELNNLASVYGRMGRLREAAAVLERTVSIRQQIFGASHQNVAIAFRNLGLTYSLAGDYARADEDLHRALKIDEANLGPAHPAVVWDLNRIGTLERKRGHFDEARRILSDARTRARQSLGTTHPEYEQALEGLGAVALARKDPDEAQQLYSEALTLQQAKFGEKHFNIAGPLEGLGAVSVARGKGAEGAAYFGRALALREATQGPTHPALAEPLRGLADAYRLLDRSDEAEKALLRAIAIVEQAHWPDHPDVATSAHALGQLLATRGDADGAHAQFSRALAIRRKVLGDAHPDTRASAAALK